jgi:putative hydrolase of the HAD superfamily
MNQTIKAIMFDMDNTLYDGREYILGAFKDISKFLAERFPTLKDEFYSALVDEFNEKGSSYPCLFDNIMKKFGLYDTELVKQIVTIFHLASPELKLYDGARDVLLRLKQQYTLALITNGNAEMQKRKVRLLGISDLFNEEIYAQADSKAEKPSIIPYKESLRRLNAAPSEAVYVGDNPHTDFIGARQLGILTVRLLRGEFAGFKLPAEYEADYEINELSELFSVLQLINKSKHLVQSRRGL